MPQVLKDHFLAQYKDKKPPFGGNGLGEFVYRRTYSRDIVAEGRKEEWWETLARSVEGACHIGAGYSTEEAQQIFSASTSRGPLRDVGCGSLAPTWSIGSVRRP